MLQIVVFLDDTAVVAAVLGVELMDNNVDGVIVIAVVSVAAAAASVAVVVDIVSLCDYYILFKNTYVQGIMQYLKKYCSVKYSRDI